MALGSHSVLPTCLLQWGWLGHRAPDKQEACYGGAQSHHPQQTRLPATNYPTGRRKWVPTGGSSGGGSILNPQASFQAFIPYDPGGVTLPIFCSQWEHRPCW